VDDAVHGHSHKSVPVCHDLSGGGGTDKFLGHSDPSQYSFVVHGEELEPLQDSGRDPPTYDGRDLESLAWTSSAERFSCSRRMRT
jgi:hypothetical protein